MAVGAGGGTYLLVSHGGTAPPPGPTAAPTPTHAPPVSAPAGSSSGEPPIEPADCTGGTPPDAYAGAAFSDICTILTPLAALSTACAGTPGPGCESAARQLSQAAESALQDIRTRVPTTAGETAAGSQLRTAFQDYVTAGNEIAQGISQGSSSLVTQGMIEVSAGTGALSSAGVDLGG